MINLTLMTSHNPTTLGKTFNLKENGELEKSTAGEMLAGACEVVTMQSLEALAAFLPTVRTNQAITASLPRNGIQSAPIVVKGALATNPGALARTKDDFHLPRGVAGLLTLDYDPKGLALGRDELWAEACKAVPVLAGAGAVHWYSGSSLIFHGDDEKRGVAGQRLYIPMADLSDLERVGKVLLRRSWLAGQGFVEISKSGSFLVRGLFDASMFQIAKLDFIGGAVCHDGLEQRRGLPTIINQGALLDTRYSILDLSPDETAEYECLLTKAKAGLEDERQEVREAWKATRKPALVMRQVARGASAEKAEALAERILNHALGDSLSGDFEITLENRAVVTVRELLAAPEKYDGMTCLDPLEPEYCGYKVVGHLNLSGGKANLFSHAHGGALYRLEAGEARSYAEWKQAIENADDDPDIFVELARGIEADPFLGETARSKLKKEVGRVGKVAVKALDADIQVIEADDNTKVIRVSAADFAASVDSAMAMLPTVPDVYEHHGQLVEAIHNTYTGESHIKRLDDVRLGFRLSTVSKWKSGEGYCSPKREVLVAVLGAGHWPGVPLLAQIAASPLLGLDGTIIDQPGYFPESQTLAVFEPQAFPKVEMNAAQCLKELRALFKETAFESAIDESAAIAMCLTIAARSTFDYAPGWVISGTDYGAGKTYTAEIAAEMGGAAAIQPWPKEEANQGKVVFAILNSQESPVTIFDNVMSDVRSSPMAAVITCGANYQDRNLGTSQTPTVSAKHSWIWTGNGIAPVADLARRVLTIRLNPAIENPALRSFKNDPRGVVRANPGYWQMLCLKLLSDYLKSGETVALPPLATFGSWSKVVRGALVWLGMPDPVEALTRGMEDDPDREDFAKLLHCWYELYGNSPQFLVDVAKVGAHGVGDDDVMGLRYILEDIAGKPDGSICKIKLGTYLGLRRERVLHRMRLKRSPRRLTPGYVWWLETV